MSGILNTNTKTGDESELLESPCSADDLVVNYGSRILIASAHYVLTAEIVSEILNEFKAEMEKDKKRLDWMEKQAGHVFDKGRGDYRRIWKSGDPRTVREEIDDMIREEDEVYKEMQTL